MTPLRGICQKLIILLFLVSFSAAAQNKDVKLVKVADAWANNSVNTVVFRHNSLVTFKGMQYTAFYDSDQRLVLARRKSGAGKWESHITQFKGNAKDAHRSISMMVDGDGFIHVSWDHHNNPLNYAKSVRPGSLELTAKLPMTGIKEKNATYPEFYSLPDGGMMFLYRDGQSGNGDLMLNRYNLEEKKWTQVQDGWINGEGQRNAYWQMTTDNLGTIHLSWVWRETGDVATNHDLCYARSKDGGITWEKSTGERYKLPITAATAEYAARIPQHSELINSTSMAADNLGRPYIATYWRSPDSKIPQYRLVYHDGAQWTVKQITERKTPFSISGGGTKRIPIARPQLVVSEKHGIKRAVMIYREEERGAKVSVAFSSDLDKGTWITSDLTSFSVGSWEPSYDTELWKRKNKLDIFVENVEQGDGETVKELAPQPVYVLSWKF